jgi:hypothetical protein
VALKHDGGVRLRAGLMEINKSGFEKIRSINLYNSI